ncbi:MAG: HAMP domain-containing protein [Nitrospirae bacterium]|nr:HAMP domain-containing protein [Nitrospirota bacterium]
MKYRSRLTVFLIALSLLITAVLFSVMYSRARTFLFKELQSKSLTVAATAAALIDGDMHGSIRERSDEGNEAYDAVRNILRRVRDANRRLDIYVAYIQTVTVQPDNPNVIRFCVDAEENIENKSHVGDLYRGQFGKGFMIDQYQVSSTPVIDQWGEWMAASAPVRDHLGNAVASVVVKINASDVNKRITKLWWNGLAALAGSVVLAMAVSSLLARYVSRPLSAIHRTIVDIGKGNLDARVEISSRDEFGEVARAINQMSAAVKDREMIKGLFARYVSHQVVDSILNSADPLPTKGSRRKITVLFSDIRSFTRLSEEMRPEAVMSLLNEYFEKMIEVVFRHNGTLDKFIGDGMMVVFGAPLDDLYQEENAVRAAVEMQQVMDELCRKWDSEGKQKLQIGIGINSGIAVVGNIGSQQRMEYTAIGDTVNLASRVSSATRDLNVDILISEYTYIAVRHLVMTREMGSITVKGRTAPINVYAVQGLKTEAAG